MAQNVSETVLLSQAMAGDALALERLLLAHYDRLLRRVERRLPASLGSVVAAEDILQQAFIAAFQGIGQFRARGRWAFYRWLCTIAEHRLRDAVRAQRSVKRGGGAEAVLLAPDDSIDQLIELLAAPRHTPSQSVARHEAMAAIQSGMAAIKDDYRRALELRYGQGQTVDQVATLMNRTPHAVHNLCYRGLKELEAAVGRSTEYLSRK